MQKIVLACTAHVICICSVLYIVLNTKILKYSILLTDIKTLQHFKTVFIFRISDNAPSDTEELLAKEIQEQKKY